MSDDDFNDDFNEATEAALQVMVSDSQRFYLYRHQDMSGISGTGVVADGIKWPDGTVTLRWRGPRPSTVNWNSVEDAEAVHGHGSATAFVWIGSDHKPIPTK